jgi:hypothetical protein
MKIDGACHCGAIRYEAEVDPARVMICHCTDCQVLSGSAFRTVVPAPKPSFRLLSGKPKVYVKTADSGNQRTQAFCGDCGTPIYSSPVSADFAFYSLRVGSMRQRAELRPSVEYFCRSKLDWTGLDGPRRFEAAAPPA